MPVEIGLQNFADGRRPRSARNETEQAFSKAEIFAVLPVSVAFVIGFGPDGNQTTVSRLYEEEGAVRRAIQVMEARRAGRETDLLQRICHEFLTHAELPVVLGTVLDLLATHVGSESAYLTILDSEQPHMTLETVRGFSGRELDVVRSWLREPPSDIPVRSLSAARQERPSDTLTRFVIGGPSDVNGVLVLDRRVSTGPAAIDEHKLILAVVSLIGSAVRFHRPQAKPLTRPTSSGPPEGSSDRASDVTQLTARHASQRRSLRAQLLVFEREILVNAMQEASGNQSRAARNLSTTPRILSYRLRRHGLHGILTKPVR
jgi:hypothetical protein